MCLQADIKDKTMEIKELWKRVEEMEKADRPQTEATYLRQIMKAASTSGACDDLLKAMEKLVSCVRRYDWKESRTLFDEFNTFGEAFKTPRQKSDYLAFLAGSYNEITDYDYRNGGYAKFVTSALDTILSFKKELISDSDPYSGYKQDAEDAKLFPCYSYFESVMRFFYAKAAGYDGRGKDNADRVCEGLVEASEGHPSSEIYTRCLLLQMDEAVVWRTGQVSVKNTIGNDAALLAEYDMMLDTYPDEPASVMPASYKAQVLFDAAAASSPQDAKKYQDVKEFCEACMKKYKASKYARNIKEVYDNLFVQNLDIRCDGFVYPGDSLTCKTDFRNIDKVVFILYRLDDYSVPDVVDSDGGIKKKTGGYLKVPYDYYLKKRAEKVWEKSFDNLGKGLGVTASEEFTLKGLDAGNYLLVAAPYKEGKVLKNSVWDSWQIRSSAVATALRQRNGLPEVYAADYRTGRPLTGAEVVFFGRNDDGGYKAKSGRAIDFEGFTKIPGESVEKGKYNSKYFNVRSGDDRNSPIISYYPDRRGGDVSAARQAGGEVYTDRMLYKPEETVKFAVVAYSADTRRGKVRDGIEVNAKLYGPGQSKPLAELRLTTDDLGTAAGEFVIQKGSMNGQYRIECDNRGGSATFRVENYSRPTFKVDMEKVGEICEFGQDVTQKGTVMNYAGFPVEGAEVKYEVWMEPMFGRTNYFNFTRTLVGSGSVKSDADGRFALKFNAKSPDKEEDELDDELDPGFTYPDDRPEDDNKKNRFVRYSVTATVSDPQGETHSAEASVRVGDTPLDLSDSFAGCADFGDFDDVKIVIKEKALPLTFSVKNLDGEDQKMNGIYSFEKSGETVLNGEFASGEALGTEYASLPSGKYDLKYSVQCNGRKVEEKRSVILLSVSDTKCPADTELFFCPVVSENGIEFLVGTSEEDLWLECELFDNDKRLDRKQLHLQNNMVKISLPYDEKYPNEVSLSLFAFRNKNDFSKNYDFKRVVDRSLKVELGSFRDMTAPGAEEEFTLHITDPRTGGTPLTSSTVSIFDVTTDRFGSNSFGFDPFPSYSSSSPYVNTNIHISSPKYGMGARAYGRKMMFINSVFFEQESVDMISMDAAPVAAKGMAVEESASGENQADNVEVRSDFGETVAFFPQVRSDADGDVTVKYKTTDALSTFRVLVRSHTADLLSGGADTSFVVRKELMVIPNLPLFIREGDRIELKAKAVNLSAKTLEGKAELVLYDASSEEGRIISKKQLRLTLNPNAQEELAWTVEAPEATPLLGVRITLAADGYSDGQQNVIAVIPSRTQITEAQSLLMDGKSVYEMNLRKLLDKVSARGGKVTIDVSSPLTSALEALPTVGEPDFDSMTSWLASLFINQTGEYMFRTYPALAEKVRELVYGGWRKSKIAVNSSITGVLLNETPWAYKESEDNARIEALAHYLDPDYTADFREKADRKLLALQNSDGGFSWFEGAQSSETLTLLFLEKFREMVQMGSVELNGTEKKMTEAACGFIDKSIEKQYEEYVKACEKAGKKPDRGTIHYGTLQAEAVRAAYKDIELEKSSREAYEFYFDCIYNNWKGTNIADKADVIALLTRAADTKRSAVQSRYDLAGEVRKVVISLNDYAVRNKTVGCYFPNAAMPFRGMMNDELYAHSHLLRLYDELSSHYSASADKEDKILGAQLSEMVKGIGQWLLLQKHNQCWENNLATTDALYALLSGGVAGADSAAGPEFEILSPEVTASEPLPGSLFRYDVPVSALRKAGCKVRIDSRYDGLLFASAYYQYTQPEQVAEASSNGISVVRRFFRSKAAQNAAGRDVTSRDIELEEIREGEPLHLGEKIIAAYTLKSDENRSFVQLRALRPACLYPEDETSGYRWYWGGYRENRESMTNYYFYLLPEGTTELHEEFFVTQEGTFSTALTSVQSLYAPEYRGQDASLTVVTQ